MELPHVRAVCEKAIERLAAGASAEQQQQRYEGTSAHLSYRSPIFFDASNFIDRRFVVSPTSAPAGPFGDSSNAAAVLEALCQPDTTPEVFVQPLAAVFRLHGLPFIRLSAYDERNAR